MPVHGGSDGGNESSVDVRTLSWGRGYATIVAQNKVRNVILLLERYDARGYTASSNFGFCYKHNFSN